MKETMKERYEKILGRCRRSMMQVEQNLEKTLNEHPEEFDEILHEKAIDSLQVLMLASFGEDPYMQVAEDVVNFFDRVD